MVWELNESSGFLSTWPVHKNHVISRGVLIAEGPVEYEYQAIERVELPNVIAKLNTDDEDAIIEFASTYGLFGYSATLGDDDRSQWGPDNKEPLWWIKQHVETVSLVLEMAECLVEADVEKRSEKAAAIYEAHLTDNLSEFGIGGNGERTPVFSFAARGKRSLFANPTPVSAGLEWVSYATCEILSHNLQGVVRQPMRNGYKVKSGFCFEALIDAVYWQIQNGIDGGSLKLCDECKKPFIATHGRQKFCPPRYIYKGHEQESTCAIAHRQRKYRNK